MLAWLKTERARGALLLLGCYAFLLIVFAVVAGTERLTEHTPYNHFALLAEAWLDGRLDLGGPPPDYAQNNDFAHFRGKWFVSFPALPAVLILPLVYLAGSAERVRDGQFFLWLAPLGPVLLLVALEQLRKLGRSELSRLQNAALALTLGLGTVFFFTAVQGTVWFAAHVVAVPLAAAYVLFAIDARQPWLAGLMLGLAYWARAPLLFAFPLFLLEAARVCAASSDHPGPQRWLERVRQHDYRRVARLVLAFGIPFASCFALSLLHNQARFDDPFDVGYKHLEVAWQGRMQKWGLFHYHYLAKNLGVVLTSLPWIEPFRINTHGLALWVTSPFYLYLLCPRRPALGHAALLITAACVGIPELFYHNTGWTQFGYRFSNDYAVFLFSALALSGRRLSIPFWLLAASAVAVNTFGAVTFERAGYEHYYYQQPSQETLYQPD